MGKRVKWFKHDSSASVDAKIERLMMKYGLEGYGLYFYCLEMIARSVESHNLTFELEHDSEIIAHRTGIHHERVQEMMAYMIDLSLFENDRGVVTCLKLATRTDEYTQKLLKNMPCPDSVPTKSALIEEKRREENRLNRKTYIPETKKRVSVPYAEIINSYHEKLPNNPHVASLSVNRKAQIRARWLNGLPDLKAWDKYFDHVNHSSFLTGQSSANNGRKPFIANIDFLIKENNVLKIIEGNYHG